MAQKRSASVGPKVPPFPNLKLKENQFALPLPPDGLSVLEKKDWLQNEWEEMWERPARRAAQTKITLPKEPRPQLPLAEPKARGRAVAGPGSLPNRSAARSGKSWWPKMLKLPKLGSGIIVLMCLAILSGQNGPITQVSRLLGAVASFGEAASSAASSAGATTLLSSHATEIVLSVASKSLSLGDTFWHGVDLFGVNATRCAGSLIVDSSAILGEWLLSNHSTMFFPCVDAILRMKLLSAGASVGFHMPKIDTETEHLIISGCYSTVHIAGTVLIDGKLQVSFDAINISFQPEWANPAWDILGF